MAFFVMSCSIVYRSSITCVNVYVKPASLPFERYVDNQQ